MIESVQLIQSLQSSKHHLSIILLMEVVDLSNLVSSNDVKINRISKMPKETAS